MTDRHYFSIAVQWGAVDCTDRNGDITGYTVRYGVQGSGSTQTESVSGGAATQVTITGLTPSTSYVVDIAAVNSAGTGVYSEPLTVETSVAGESIYTLIVLLWILQICNPSGAFVRFLEVDLSNHSYVNLTAVGDAMDGSDSVQCRTDLSTCCNAAAGGDFGDWFFPSGTVLPFPDAAHNIFESRRMSQRVDLRHRGTGGAISGIYRCTIETNAVNDDDGRETVYAGLYASGGEEKLKYSPTELHHFLLIVPCR